MKVSKDKWFESVNNLIERRKTGVKDNQKCESIIADYGRHMRSVFIGKTLLDVGCGDQSISKLLPEGVDYTGIDAFPCVPKAIKMQIEECSFEDKSFDTLVCFAVLDSLYDLKAATEHMKRITRKNIVFLTGVNIEPDRYHTVMITEALLDGLMEGWKVNMKNYLTPQVILIEYVSDESN